MHVIFCKLYLFVEGLERKIIGLSHSWLFVLYGDVSQQFYVGPDRFVVRDVFLSVFYGGSIVTIKMGKSTRTCPDETSGRERVLLP